VEVEDEARHHVKRAVQIEDKGFVAEYPMNQKGNEEPAGSEPAKVTKQEVDSKRETTQT